MRFVFANEHTRNLEYLLLFCAARRWCLERKISLTRKIALISEHASPLASAGGVDSGGQNIYVAQVARHLARIGYAVDVFTRRDSANQAEIVQWQPRVRVINVPAGPAQFVRKEELLPLMNDFSAYVTNFARMHGDYAVVHANFFMSALVAMHLKRALGTPFVVTFHALGRVRRLHQNEADQFPALRMDIEDQAIAQADAIIAECPQDKEDLTSLYQADARRITVIPCGFDKAEFWPIARPFARRALGLDPKDNIILNIGRLVPRKGIDNAVRALGRLARNHQVSAKLLVVGGNSDVPCPVLTPEIGRLHEIAVEEGVADQVLFTGRRSREFLKLYYNAADVFVTTPWYEPFGITPLEAMACGTPVVGANVGGIKHSVADGFTGSLVPPNDPDALAQSLAKMFRDPDYRKELGRNAIDRVHEQFTWAKVAGALSGLYRNVLSSEAVAA
jgi:glycosyltransferase involved in cell wall biosynthesis